AAQVVGTKQFARPAQHLMVAVLLAAAHVSQIPTTSQRTGEFLLPMIWRAPRPSFDTMTRWPIGALRGSMARIGSPSAWPVPVIGCTASSRHPCILGCLIEEIAWPTTIPICMAHYTVAELVRVQISEPTGTLTSSAT